MEIEAMDAFGMSSVALDRAGAHWTAREILQQPAVWLQIERQVGAEAAALAGFLLPLLKLSDLRIVLSGAGTSAFVGECLAPAMTRVLGRRVEAIATTDLVSSARSWLSAEAPTLLVSFARSGNSPESTAALEIAQAYLKYCSHLVVTCNPQGSLCRRARSLPNARVIVLPEATNDRSFAMTSSFTGMLLAAAAAFGVVPPGARIATLARQVARALPACTPMLQALVQEQFERVVYLGSSELKGLAREAALKMLELTDGQVIAAADSPLGFRHGPKTILNRKALVVVFLCRDPHARRYELDLVSELRREAVACRVITLAAATAVAPHPDDLVLGVDSPEDIPVSDLELCLAYAPFAQSLALLRSLSARILPDTPNAAGTVNRVVQGVTIYPWPGTR